MLTHGPRSAPGHGHISAAASGRCPYGGAFRSTWGVVTSFDPDIPASFYEVVGRIAVGAATLEERLVDLVIKVDDVSKQGDRAWLEALEEGWSEHGGRPGTVLVKHVKQGFRPHVPDLDRDEFELYLTAVEQALNARHEVMHSKWVTAPPGAPGVFIGTRRLPKHMRPSPDKVSVTITRTEEQLQGESAQLESLAQRVELWKGRIRSKTFQV